jgi:signal transduction histidine kinase
MLVWEGGFLLVTVVLGGISLVVLTVRDRNNFKKLQTFFSIFSHDLKTSIARLRIQAEILQESEESNPALNRLTQDIDRLNLQLENALWVARGDEIDYIIEKIKISTLIVGLKSEFPELNIRIMHDAFINVDKRLMTSVFRNLFHNSIHHGKATEVKITSSKINNTKVKIEVIDNGLGVENLSADIGEVMLNPKEGKTNGIGLYLTKKIVEKQKGEISFDSKMNGGFFVSLILEGALP